ncbi:MAG: PAS domain S-box protein [Ginsengibacter sp.]
MRIIAKIPKNNRALISKSAKEASNSKLGQMAFDNSIQANIVIIIRGKIIMANNAACNLLGYSQKELLTKNQSDIFDVNESAFKKMLKQRTAKGHSIAYVTAINKKGKKIPCEITSSLFVGEHNIKKSVFTLEDISLRIRNQRNIDTKKEKIVAYHITLAETKQRNIDAKKEKVVARNIVLAKSRADAKLKDLRFVFKSSLDALYDYNLITNRLIISDGFQKEFGYKIVGNMTRKADWISHIHPDDRKEVFNHLKMVLASKDAEWKYGYRLVKADNSMVNITSNAVILRDAAGKAYRIIGSMHDNTQQITLEQKLKNEIILKEKEIQEAIENAKDAERLDLGKELHDNVNQLLGASKLYLDLAKRGGKDKEMYFSRSSEYTLTAIEEIRNITKGLTTDIISSIGLCKAIENIARDTMEVHPVKIAINCAVDSYIENSVNDKFDLNIFRIIQEQLNNVLKHAKASEVNINLLQNKKSVILLISDDGIGFDTKKNRNGIVLDNIKSRAKMYNGTAEFVSQPGKGCVLTVTFPHVDASIRL